MFFARDIGFGMGISKLPVRPDCGVTSGIITTSTIFSPLFEEVPAEEPREAALLSPHDRA